MDEKRKEELTEAGLEGEDHGASSQLQRKLNTTHIIMISIGSSIGMGLWLGSGKSLAMGGPASLFLGYCFAGTIIWSLSQSIGEMAVMYPVPSAFVQWTNKFVDQAAGFALGWAYWASYVVGIANELQGIVTVLKFWTNSLPTAAALTVFLVFYILVNLGGVKLFGHFEVVVSSIKFVWIFVAVIASIVISAGGAPKGDKIGFRYWKTPDEAFLNGFKGFLSVLPTTIFAYAGSENAAMAIAELKNPLKAMPKAVKSIWIRLACFYVLGSLAVGITTDPKDKELFGNKGTGASPFVVAFRTAGLPGLAHAMNAVIFLSVLSSGLVGSYAGSRTTVGLAHIGMAPKIMAYADKSGRPWPSLALIFVFGGGLSYLNVTESGANVFTWLSNLSSLFALFGWGMIAYSNVRFRQAWKLQGRTVEELPWASSTFPYTAYWTIFWCLALIIVEFYLAVWPLHEKPSAKTFFANYISVFFIVIMYIGAKIWYRGSFLVDLKTVDLDEERRFYAPQTMEEKPKRRLWKGLV
jgi:amino acid transporter